MNFTDLRVLKTEESFQNALLELLKEKELKAITVKEICDNAGVSRNAFYQHYGYKKDLYDQMVEKATAGIRQALIPVLSDSTSVQKETTLAYATQVIEGISLVSEILRIMIKGDNGAFLTQLTDQIFQQNLTQLLSICDVEENEEIRLFTSFYSAGEAEFIIRWVQQDNYTKEKAAWLLSELLRKPYSDISILNKDQNNKSKLP